MAAEPIAGSAFLMVKGWHDNDWYAVRGNVRRHLAVVYTQEEWQDEATLDLLLEV